MYMQELGNTSALVYRRRHVLQTLYPKGKYLFKFNIKDITATPIDVPPMFVFLTLNRCLTT